VGLFVSRNVTRGGGSQTEQEGGGEKKEGPEGDFCNMGVERDRLKKKKKNRGM